MHGVRARLTVTLVALVALTAGLLALGAYVFVDTRLHDQTRDDAANQARFDLTVLIPRSGMPADATADDIVASGVLGTLHQRGIETIVARGGEELARSSTVLEGALTTLPADLTTRVANGELAYAWTDVAGQPSLVVGGRLEPDGPDFYFVHDATELERALSQLRIALAAGFVAAVLVASWSPARSREVFSHRSRLPVTRPNASRRATSRRACRCRPMTSSVSGRDGSTRWPTSRPARSAGSRPPRHRTAASSPTSRTSFGPRSRRWSPRHRSSASTSPVCRPTAGGRPSCSSPDVARLRALVEDLMEISRFDARAEQVATRAVDVAALVRSVAAARLPAARSSFPKRRVIIESDVRRLERILGNLLDNAREHAAGAPVDVYADARGVQTRRRGRRPRPRCGRPTGLPTSSSASTRPIRRATAVAADWVSRSRRNMPPCSVGR